jgi:hypothetical protein
MEYEILRKNIKNPLLAGTNFFRWFLCANKKGDGGYIKREADGD